MSSHPNSLRPSNSSHSVRNTGAPPSSRSSNVVLSIDAALAAASGNPMAALETVLAERNNLYQQNTQLWKLMEKSRSGYANSLKDLERIRGERDKAVAKLELFQSSSSSSSPTSASLAPASSSGSRPPQTRSYSLEPASETRPLVVRHQSQDNPRSDPRDGLHDDSLDPSIRRATEPLPMESGKPHSGLAATKPSVDIFDPMGVSLTNPQVNIHPPSANPVISPPTFSSSPPAAVLESAPPLIPSTGHSSSLFQPRSRAAARESRITLPDEAARYITSNNIGDSPIPSPQGPSGKQPVLPGTSSSLPSDFSAANLTSSIVGEDNSENGETSPGEGPVPTHARSPPPPTRRRPSTPQEPYASSIISTTSSRSHSRTGFSISVADGESYLQDLDEEADLDPSANGRTSNGSSGPRPAGSSASPPPSPIHVYPDSQAGRVEGEGELASAPVSFTQESHHLHNTSDSFKSSTSLHGQTEGDGPYSIKPPQAGNFAASLPNIHSTGTRVQPSLAPPTTSSTPGHPQLPSPTHPNQTEMAPNPAKPTYRSTRLTVNDLPYTKIKVQGSNIKTNDRGKEVLSFIFTIYPSGDNQQASSSTAFARKVPTKESWMVEKLYSEILALDSNVRTKLGKSGSKKLAPLPDGKLFKDHAPAKADQRKAILETYIQTLITGPFKTKDEICMFLSTDLVRNGAKAGIMHSGYKEGYLTKRGKNFGGWRTRYFVLQSPVLEYYESRGGQHLGSIVITGAQIGRQQRNTQSRDSEDENSYRHAFLIIEAKKGPGGTSVRHVLCAESDEERDSWVEVLVRYVVAGSNPMVMQPKTSVDSPGDEDAPVRSGSDLRNRWPGGNLAKDDAPKNSMDSSYTGGTDSSGAVTVPSGESVAARRLMERSGQAPVSDVPTSTSLPSHLDQAPRAPFAVGGLTPNMRSNSELGYYAEQPGGERRGSPSAHVAPLPSSTSAGAITQTTRINRTSFHPNFASMKSGNAAIDRAPSPDKLPSVLDGPNKGKIISGPMNGTPIPAGYKFGAKDPPPQEAGHGHNSERERKAKSGRFWGFGRTYGGGPSASTHIIPRAVFGVSLESSLEVAQIADLPAIVFRCIEYLEAKNAELEEGIYRLSGSSNVIKNLKERFNTEGDVDLSKSEDYWDVHAITGLLKSFLRDLPTGILTRDLHLRFLGVIDLANPQERIDELASLVSQLPLPNYSLLRALTAHLILIVSNANVNKMTMRNVGIVFSPTLGIPAGVFGLMLSEFEQVFNVAGGATEANGKQEDVEDVEVESPPTEKISNRNSRSYAGGDADKLLGLGGRKLKPTEEESDDNDDLSLPDSSPGSDTENEPNPQAPSSSPPETPGPATYSGDSAHLKTPTAHAASVAAQRGLQVNVNNSPTHPANRRVSGLPSSPRPPPRVNPGQSGTSSTPSPSSPMTLHPHGGSI